VAGHSDQEPPAVAEAATEQTSPEQEVPEQEVPEQEVPEQEVPEQEVPEPDVSQVAAPEQAAPEQAAQARAADSDLAIDAELAPDDPSSDETAPDPADGTIPYPSEAGHDISADALSPAPTEPDPAADPEMPVFHRIWSSPMPPAGQDE
jgi:hypothetical protein